MKKKLQQRLLNKVIRDGGVSVSVQQDFCSLREPPILIHSSPTDWVAGSKIAAK
jgi:hypothetical protein